MEDVGIGVEAPLPAEGAFHGAVGMEHQCRGGLLLLVGISEVDMLPCADKLVGRHRGLWHSAVALGQHHGPTAWRPEDATHMTHHDGIGVGVAAVALRQTSLGGIEPVALTIVEDGTMADAYPAVDVACRAELIGMGNHRKALSTGGDVGAVHAHIGACDVARAGHTGVVGHGELIVSQEEVVVTGRGVIDHLGSLAALPARRGVAGSDATAIGGVGAGARLPRVGKRRFRLACSGVYLYGNDTAVPRAINEPVGVLGGDNIRGIYGVEAEPAAPLAAGTERRGCLVAAAADDEALVLPDV